MAAPTVHLLNSATFTPPSPGSPIVFADAQSASIDEGGQVSEYTSAAATDVQLIAVDRIAATVTLTLLSYLDAPAVGDPGSLSIELKARAEGKGTAGAAVTKTWGKAVCTGKGLGPVIEGTPSYTITFRCHAAP